MCRYTKTKIDVFVFLVQGAERLSQLQELLQKVYLRRTKAIIADQLPKKKVRVQ